MAQEIKDFGRFFALLRKMPYTIDEDERHSMVVLATGGRTNSLREMTWAEYNEMCSQLEFKVHRNTQSLRKRRSCVLHQMQKMGVDTTDWGRVDALCMDARIAGKKFAWLSEEELRSVEVKLRSIERRGGLSGSRENREAPTKAEEQPVGDATGTVAAKEGQAQLCAEPDQTPMRATVIMMGATGVHTIKS